MQGTPLALVEVVIKATSSESVGESFPPPRPLIVEPFVLVAL